MGSFGPESYSEPLWCCFSCRRGGGGGGGAVGDYSVMSKTAGFETTLPPVRQVISNYCAQNMA